MLGELLMTLSLRGRRLLFQRLSEGLLCLGEFVGSLVKLFLQVGYRGTATARSHRLLGVLGLRRPGVPSFHCDAARSIRLARSHATSAIDVTNDHPLMKPSHGA